MDKKRIKSDSGRAIGGWGAYNQEGTYGIVGEDGEVIKVYEKLQTFRGKSAADNRCIELNRDRFRLEVLKVEKLR